jgi:hypothetical protein
MMIRRTAAIGGTTDTRDHSTAVGATGSLIIEISPHSPDEASFRFDFVEIQL